MDAKDQQEAVVSQAQMLPPTQLPPNLPPQMQQVAQAAALPVNAVKTLLSWRAPGRPFKPKGKEYFLNILVIMFAVQIILFLFSQYMLMILVAALVFLTFALAIIPPHDFLYKISTQGITIENHFYYWDELYDFYFKNIEGMPVLHVSMKAYYPGELTLTLGDMHADHVRAVLLPYLPYREIVQETIMDKASGWLVNTFPLERTQAQPQAI